MKYYQLCKNHKKLQETTEKQAWKCENEIMRAWRQRERVRTVWSESSCLHYAQCQECLRSIGLSPELLLLRSDDLFHFQPDSHLWC